MSTTTRAIPAPAKDPRDPFAHFHPMEVFPFFRGFRKSIARDLIFTIFFNCGLAVVFWVMGAVFGSGRLSLLSLGWIVLVSNVMGFSIHVCLMVSGAIGLYQWMHRRGSVVTAI